VILWLTCSNAERVIFVLVYKVKSSRINFAYTDEPSVKLELVLVILVVFFRRLFFQSNLECFLKTLTVSWKKFGITFIKYMQILQFCMRNEEKLLSKSSCLNTLYLF
jgi:hypothetical protein